jgi:hypothetical protein
MDCSLRRFSWWESSTAAVDNDLAALRNKLRAVEAEAVEAEAFMGMEAAVSTVSRNIILNFILYDVFCFVRVSNIGTVFGGGSLD